MDWEQVYADAEALYLEQMEKDKARILAKEGAILCADCGWPYVPGDPDDGELSCPCNTEPVDYPAER